ncbi:MAG: hypothetical protein ABI042_18670 [Verrucomicrobiota bacterium]
MVIFISTGGKRTFFWSYLFPLLAKEASFGRRDFHGWQKSVVLPLSFSTSAFQAVLRHFRIFARLPIKIRPAGKVPEGWHPTPRRFTHRRIFSSSKRLGVGRVSAAFPPFIGEMHCFSKSAGKVVPIFLIAAVVVAPLDKIH